MVQQRNSEPLVDDPVRAASQEHPDPESPGAETPESHLYVSGLQQQRDQSHHGVRLPRHEL